MEAGHLAVISWVCWGAAYVAYCIQHLGVHPGEVFTYVTLAANQLCLVWIFRRLQIMVGVPIRDPRIRGADEHGEVEDDVVLFVLVTSLSEYYHQVARKATKLVHSFCFGPCFRFVAASLLVVFPFFLIEPPSVGCKRGSDVAWMNFGLIWIEFQGFALIFSLKYFKANYVLLVGHLAALVFTCSSAAEVESIIDPGPLSSCLNWVHLHLPLFKGIVSSFSALILFICALYLLLLKLSPPSKLHLS